MTSKEKEPSVADTQVIKDENDIKERCLPTLIEVFYEFADNNTLNGLKYIAEKGVSILERLFWISTFILSTILCITMICQSYLKYERSGVVITLKEHLVSVNEYPFPAVTICSETRTNQKRYNFTDFVIKSLKVPDAAGQAKFHSAVVLCDNDENLNATSYEFLNYSVDMSTFFEMAPTHDDIFRDCLWRNKINCKTKFRPVLTADGVCYTFNILATDEIFRENSIDHKDKRYYLNTTTPQKGWSLENNFYTSENDSFPRRGRANGAREDLFITLNEVKHRDFMCDEQTRPGYKVYLHHPAELPQASLHRYSAQPGKTTSLAIKLDIIDTAEDLVDYTPQIRQCYYPSERGLQFFQKYTSLNCQLECLTNYTIQICGCVAFYMPRNRSTAICKAHKRKCIDDAIDKYAEKEDLNGGKNSQCECLPPCNDINYDADVVLTKLDLQEYKKKYLELIKYSKNETYDNGEEMYNSGNSSNIYEEDTQPVDKLPTFETSETEIENETDANWTQIRIYYRRPRFVAMERSVLIGLAQFLADVGGTLGLFLGFSFLTFAEIFYFFTLKLFCRLLQQNSAKKSDKSSNTSDMI